jgi:dimethylhistidine N-methyltransferase
LLANLQAVAGYILVDLGPVYLRRCAEILQHRFPDIPIASICTDFTIPFHLPEMPRAARRKIFFFPGSTIGNLEPDQTQQLLRRLSAICGPGGGLLIGIDLQKDRERLERAYNDSAGVTAAFNLNLLKRIKTEFQSDVDPSKFVHRAFYNEKHARIEMHLVSQAEQQFRLNGTVVHFARQEPLVTEHSYKYTDQTFLKLVESCGWLARGHWTDAERLFSVHFLETEGAGEDSSSQT